MPGLRPDLRDFPAFRDGAAARAPFNADTGLSDPSRWLFGASDQAPIHVILTIAADDLNDLEGEIARQRTLAAQHSLLLVFEQRGETLPGERAGHEHFGFKDGISQPGIKGYHPTDPDKPSERLGHPGTEMIEAGEFVLGLASESHLARPPTAQPERSHRRLADARQHRRRHRRSRRARWAYLVAAPFAGWSHGLDECFGAAAASVAPRYYRWYLGHNCVEIT